ncbi:MAG: hypothetical protein K2I69_07150 [Muribaculaceae bacterium]|nr:hypothetical protein [Muribaculaceae bacterium]
MKLGIRSKRNISLLLLVTGVACTIGRLLYLIQEPSSTRAWFNMCSIVFLTSFCAASFMQYQKQLNHTNKQ